MSLATAKEPNPLRRGRTPGTGSELWTWGPLTISRSRKGPTCGGVGWYLCVSHPVRYPTWDEIRECRDRLLPPEKTFVMFLPPKDEYVNVHPNCFHLHEYDGSSV